MPRDEVLLVATAQNLRKLNGLIFFLATQAACGSVNEIGVLPFFKELCKSRRCCPKYLERPPPIVPAARAAPILLHSMTVETGQQADTGMHKLNLRYAGP